MGHKHPDAVPHPLYSAFVQYQRELHRYLAGRLKNKQTAQDLAQEVYLRLLRVDNSETVRNPLGYLYGIASHVVYQYKIRKHRVPVVFDSKLADETAEYPMQEAAPDALERVNLRQALEAALAELPAMQQAVLLLRQRDGFSLAEIAEQLNLSVHTVKKYLFQAKTQLRMRWDSQGNRSDE